MANHKHQGENKTYASQIELLCDYYRQRNTSKALNLIHAIRNELLNNNKIMPKLSILIQYIENKIKNNSNYKQNTSAPTSNVYTPPVKSIGESPEANHNFFELLRRSYETALTKQKINTPRPSISSSLEKNQINIIHNARPMIIWENNRTQVLGKKQSKKTSLHSKRSKIIDFQEKIKKTSLNSEFYIVTPSYNSAKFIDSTIMSVISQEGNFSIRYHIQDGGSTDGTINKLISWGKILKQPDCQLIRCNKLTFTFDSSPDSGMYAAINKGFEKINSSENGIASWINSDDVYVGGAFATALKIFKSNICESWIISSVNGCNEHQEEVSNIQLQYPTEIIRNGLCDHINWSFIQQEGSFWRKSLWTKVKGVNSRLKYCGDWDLWRRFAEYAEPIHVLWPLGRFRIHDTQLTTSLESYRNEIDTVISQTERNMRMKSLQDSTFDSIKMVHRLQNPRSSSLIFKQVPLSKQYINPNISSTQNLINHLIDNSSNKQKQIKVLAFTTQASGGAGTGSTRRVDALQNIGVNAKLLSLYVPPTQSKKSYIGKIEPTLDAFNSSDQNNVWQLIYKNFITKITQSKEFKGQEIFSIPDSVLTFRQLQPIIDEYDIIHLHWTVGMVDYNNIAEILGKKPLVITTGDMNPFTGGCHYSEGCEGFISECKDCPIISKSSNFPHLNWKLKKQAYDSLNISVVCPSAHIAKLVKKSSLLGKKPIHIIPNAYPIDQLIPVDNIKARQKLKLPLDKKLILFGADSVTAIRKGGDFLRKIVELFVRTNNNHSTEIVLFGQGDIDLPLNIHALGKLNQNLLKYAYSATDVFISLSREDVGPMTVVESLLCGTPVVGFPVGVITEVAEHKVTGYFAKPFKVEEIVEGINWFLNTNSENKDIINKCRNAATKYSDPIIAAKRYKALYEKILEKH